MKINKPVCCLIGQDGNIFNLMGKVDRVLKKEGLYGEAKEMVTRVVGSKSYDEALSIIGEYVKIR